jgi:hypothetical protein
LAQEREHCHWNEEERLGDRVFQAATPQCGKRNKVYHEEDGEVQGETHKSAVLLRAKDEASRRLKIEKHAGDGRNSEGESTWKPEMQRYEKRHIAKRSVEKTAREKSDELYR